MIKMKFSMTITKLKNKWFELSENNNTSGFRSLRISPECLSDIFIGVNKVANRCLILALPKDSIIDFKGTIKENLTIEFYKEKQFIVLQLTDNNYYDLFDDLIISLYQRIKDISVVNEYSKEFIYTFYKWSEFFEDKKSDRLSELIIKGMIGELLILKSLVNQSNSININDILNSWKGPYDKGHDFELDTKDIEVKTKDVSKLDITISSEYQLENDFDKRLELIVVSVENDKNNGLSIKDLILEIRNSVAELLGDCSILFKAISQKGLTLKNIHQYDDLRFKPIFKAIYDINSFGFPKLINSNIPKEINGLSYNIRISTLDEYIISKTDF